MYPVFKPAYKGHKFLQYAYPGSSPALDGNRGPQHGFLPFPLLHMVVGALEASASLCYSSALSLFSSFLSIKYPLSVPLKRRLGFPSPSHHPPGHNDCDPNAALPFWGHGPPISPQYPQQYQNLRSRILGKNRTQGENSFTNL